MPNGKLIMVRRARFVPIMLLAGAIWMGVSETAWWYLSIPCIVTGWFCATPNLNMANGCLAYLFMVAGFVLLGFHEPSGSAIVAGALAGFYLSALEMRVTAKPYIRDAEPFSAEVLYQGEVIADLTTCKFIEMFWREYRIEPRTNESREILANDELWEQCVFEFRDPGTGNVCKSAFVGGTKPFIKNGRVALRGLQFGG